jgi:hypothetical protein
MEKILTTALLLAFAIGLGVMFLYGGGTSTDGFNSDANNMRTITKDKLGDAQTEMAQ